MLLLFGYNYNFYLLKYIYNLLFIIFKEQNAVEFEKRDNAAIYCCFFSKFIWKSYYEYREKIENVLQGIHED